MKLFDPDPNLRWLFALTHPDDELAIAAWIRRLALAGAEVHLSWTTSNPERRWEARDAARSLGVPEDRLHFLPGLDRAVETQLESLLPVVRALVEAVEPDRIVVGAFEQGHLDHDSTNFLFARATADGNAIGLLETPLYHAYCQPIPTLNRFAAPSPTESTLPLAPIEIEFKKALARSYPSQNIWGNVLLYRVLQILRGEKETIGTVERLRLQTHFDFRAPNLPAPLAARVIRTARWRRWLAAMESLNP